MTEHDAILALNAVPDLGAVRIRKLIRFFGSALKVWDASRKDLLGCGVLGGAQAKNIFEFSCDKFLQREYNLMQHGGISVLTADDADFPYSFRDLDNAPVALYIKGQADSLKVPSVALVGSRAASFYGCGSAKIFAKAFARAGLAVTSGLARGIDTAAHQGALEAGGKTIAVTGCGFNHIYPKENGALMEKIAVNGAVVTEFAFHMPPLQHNFPWRNRIISALSLAVVVVEAGSRSGAIITADYALMQNKDVFVLPSNIDNETAIGSNELLRDGALVALNPEDVLYALGMSSPSHTEARPMVLLTPEQEKVYPYISQQPVHMDELAKLSGITVSALMNITLSLELKRVIRQLPGQYYVRNAHA